MKIQNLLTLLYFHTILVSSIIVVISGAVEGTNVSGILLTNTTWTLEKSPYYIVGNVLVPEGGELSIEAGVTIEFDGYYKIYVDGNLEARGNISEYISFLSNSTPNYDNYAGIIFRETSCCGENILDRVIMENIKVGVSSSSIELTNSIMNNSSAEIYSKYLSIIENNTFRNCSEHLYITNRDEGYIDVFNNHFDNCPIDSDVEEGSLNFNNNIMHSADYEGVRLHIEDNAKVIFYNNTIYKNRVGVSIGIESLEGYFKFLNNQITNNSVGLHFRSITCEGDSDISISGNTISNNERGLIFYGGRRSYNVPPNELFNMTYNNLINNSNFNVVCDFNFPDSISIPYNWWGTTNTSKINESIYDFYDDFAKGYILYQPVLSEFVTTTTITITTTSTTTTTIPSGDDPPRVYIDYSPSNFVFTDENIEITVSATDDNGLLYIWAGDDRGLYEYYDCNGATYCSNTWNVKIEDEGFYWLIGVAMDSNNQFKRITVGHIFVMDGSNIPSTSTTTTTTTLSTSKGAGGGSGNGGGHGGGGYGAKPMPSCFDGIQNCHDDDCEEGVDCGGSCKPCSSCSDGIQNQGETGIDCGGSCAPCLTTTTITTTSMIVSTTTFTTTTLSESTTTLEETKSMSIAPLGVIGQVTAFSKENPELVKGIVIGSIISMSLVVYVGYIVYRKRSGL